MFTQQWLFGASLPPLPAALSLFGDYALWGLLALCALAACGLAYLMARQRLSSAKKIFKEHFVALGQDLPALGKRVRDLEQKDFYGYISNAAHWLSKFSAATLDLYRETVRAHRAFRARHAALKERLEEAEKLSKKKCSFPWLKHLNAAIDMLVGLNLNATLRALPDEESESFDESPANYAVALGPLADALESGLAEIEKAADACTESGKKLKALLAEVAQARSSFASEGFAVEPYEAKISDLLEAEGEFLQQKESDPVGSLTAVEELLRLAGAIKDEIQGLIECKRELESQVADEIANAERDVSEARKRPAINLFPPPEGEQAQMPPDSPPIFLLLEPECNPDVPLKLAREHSRAAHIALVALEMKEAQRHAKEARREASKASRLVADTLASKRYVEDNVPEIRTRLQDLTEALADRSELRAQLASFMRANWEAEASQFDQADLILASGLDAIAADYDAQNYIAAGIKAKELPEQIATLISAFAQAPKRLAQLQKYRDNSRQIVADCRGRAEELSGKIERQSFITSEDTRAEFDRLGDQLAELEEETVRAVTDWVTAHTTASAVKNGLKEIGNQLDAQKTAYERASEKFELASTTVRDARRVATTESIRRQAELKLADASRLYAELEQAIKIAGSDWTKLAQDAELVIPLARDAKKLANTDRENFEKAQRQLEEARSKKIRLGKHASGSDISAAMQRANDTLAESERAFEAREWTDACNKALHASRSYQGALSNYGL